MEIGQCNALLSVRFSSTLLSTAQRRNLSPNSHTHLLTSACLFKDTHSHTHTAMLHSSVCRVNHEKSCYSPDLLCRSKDDAGYIPIPLTAPKSTHLRLSSSHTFGTDWDVSEVKEETQGTQEAWFLQTWGVLSDDGGSAVDQLSVGFYSYHHL